VLENMKGTLTWSNYNSAHTLSSTKIMCTQYTITTFRCLVPIYRINYICLKPSSVVKLLLLLAALLVSFYYL
jgi:hypothetical protein